MTRPPLYTYVPDWPSTLAIAPAIPLATNDVDGALIAELDPGKGGKALIEPITAFKRELDRRLNAQVPDEAPEDLWLRSHGFVKKPSGRGVGGLTFIRWLFGPFWQSSLEGDLCRVPAWACVGWNRKQRPALPAAEAADVARDLDEQTRRNVDERSIGHWLAPFPLVLMGEGQNRVDLYEEHGLPLMTQLRIASIAPAASLRLQRVFGCKDLAALHCDDARFWLHGQATALLPFPALAVPVLEAYGVRWTAGRYLLTPRARALRDAAEHPSNDPTSGLDRWRPRAWRSMFLSQCYV